MKELALLPMRIAELCNAVGASPINRLPGAWIYDIDEHWRIVANGQPHTVYYEDFAIESYYSAIIHDGFMVFLGNPFEGGVLGDSEDMIIEVLDAAIARAVPSQQMRLL